MKNVIIFNVSNWVAKFKYYFKQKKEDFKGWPLSSIIKRR